MVVQTHLQHGGARPRLRSVGLPRSDVWKIYEYIIATSNDFFHYKAGSYEVTLDDPAEFGTTSETLITSTSIKGIDINISAPTFFPPLAGGPVSFHADFAAFSSPPIFSSDALPTNTNLGPASFVDGNVTLLPSAGVVSGSNLTTLTLTAVAPGDYDNNGLIDAADYVVWRQTLGQTGTGLAADGNDDNKIDQTDYEVWRSHFGLTAASGAGTISSLAVVPEPASVLLLILGAAVGISTRKWSSADSFINSLYVICFNK